MSLDFATIKSKYPLENKKDLFENVLGGGFVKLVNDPNYNNTCAIRMSVTFNRNGNGYEISESYGKQDGSHTDKYGNHIIIRVKTIFDYYKKKIGEPYWGISKQPGTPFDFSEIPSVTGVLLYHANFSNASGHTDLWTGTSCLYSCPAIDVATAFDIALWKVD